MDSHIPNTRLKDAFKDYPKYQLDDSLPNNPVTPAAPVEETKSWVETYKPILLIFGYIIGIKLLIEYMHGEFFWMQWMSHFMAGFFLVFSFFKLLNLKGFAESYSMYDIVAKNGAAGVMYMLLQNWYWELPFLTDSTHPNECCYLCGNDCKYHLCSAKCR